MARRQRKVGDVSRKRRLYGCPAQVAYYARYRAARFARRFGGFVSD